MDRQESDRLVNSIRSLTQELEEAQREFVRAQHVANFAREVENQAQLEVQSLLQLIAIRTKRLGPNAPDTSSAKQAQPELDLRGSDGGVLDNEAAAASSAEDDSQPEINRVDWVYKFVCESGSRGVKPTDVLAAASRAKITMHKNYPYVVLRKLVERGKVVKKRGRYYPAT